MSFVFGDWLTGLVNEAPAAEGYLGSAIGRSSIIRTGLDAGETPTAILGTMRDLGLGMRTQNFYGLVHSLQETAAGGPGLLTGVVGATVPPDAILQLEGGTSGQFMVNVRMHYSLTTDQGDFESGYRTTSIIQQGAVDLDQALIDAQSIWDQASPEGYKLGTLTAQEVSGVYQWQGR